MSHTDHEIDQLVELMESRRLVRQESEWLEETRRRLRAKRLARLAATATPPAA
jgi:hypothetical protein